MKLRPALQIAGIINIVIAAMMLSPLAVTLYYKDGDTGVFIYSIIICAIIGGVMFTIFRGKDFAISHREGFLVVSFSWITASLSCSVPFIVSGYFPSLVDAIFEGVSGITTTGASVLIDIESLSHGMLFWRSMTHWIGGVGIVLLCLAILPLLGVGGMQLYKAEASVVSSDKIAPRVREMARIILAVYLAMSISMLVILKLLGMDLFNATLHMFATVSTAGFSPKNASVGHFNSVYIEAVIVLFMILGATNFALHFKFFRDGYKIYTKNSEFKFYIIMMAVASLLIGVNLWFSGETGIFDSFRQSIFQVVSVITTTGFSTVDFSAWPAFGQIMLLVLMFTGGCAGSTTGSIKSIRLLLMIKLGYKEIYRLIHPHAIVPVKLGGRLVGAEILRSVMGFTILYLLVFIISSCFLGWLGVDLTTAISSAAATISNVGPALGLAGPVSGYAFMPEPGKWVLILNMLLGRLEIYTLMILFIPAFWRG